MSSQLLNSSLTFYIGLTVLLQLISISSCQSSISSDDCTTPSGQRGQCINIRQCQSVTAILRNAPNPIPESTRKMVVSLGCGYEGRDPKVCCNKILGENDPNPTVPDPAQPNYYSEAPPAVEGHPNLKLLPANCGVVYEVRVAGGNKPKVFEFPWMASLAYESTSGKRFRCGGTVINEKYILSAAHCLVLSRSQGGLVEVRVGQHDVTEVDCNDENMKACSPPYQDIAVEEAIPHPDYKHGRYKYQNDIGLVKLASPIDLSQMNVVPICLPHQKAYREKPLNNTKLWISGWGATEEGKPSENLLSEKVPYVPNDQCTAKYNKLTVVDGVGFRQLCAGGNLDEGGDVCEGDAGGPLQAKEYFDGFQRYVQYGIVSFGPRRCGASDLPSVYTRVSHYVKWILDTIKA